MRREMSLTASDPESMTDFAASDGLSGVGRRSVTPLSELRLSRRVQGALEREHVLTVEDLLRAIENGKLRDFRGIGSWALAEIDAALFARAGSLNPNPTAEPVVARQGGHTAEALQRAEEGRPAYIRGAGMPPRARPDTVSVGEARALKKAIDLLVSVVEAEIRAGRLHPQCRLRGRHLEEWLEVARRSDNRTALTTLRCILAPSHNLCDELSALVKGVSSRNVRILAQRHGVGRQTLEGIARVHGLTRERVRQITAELPDRLRRRVELMVGRCRGRATDLPLLRIQSAILRAADLGDDLTYSLWRDTLTTTGLVGKWPGSELSDLDPLALLEALLRSLGPGAPPELSIPDNLARCLELAARGEVDRPAGCHPAAIHMDQSARREASRRARHTGAVSLAQLGEATGLEAAALRRDLISLGYREASGGWFIAPSNVLHRTNRLLVVNRLVRKMLQYCGPLSLADLAAGLGHSAAVVGLSAPPPEVLALVLDELGYPMSGGRYCDRGTGFEVLRLGRAEATLLECVRTHGPVVHHAQLLAAFRQAGLSVPALHKALAGSPLFLRIGRALYCLRGNCPDRAWPAPRQAVERRPRGRRAPRRGAVGTFEQGGRQEERQPAVAPASGSAALRAAQRGGLV